MNPLDSIKSTLTIGFILAVLIIFTTAQAQALHTVIVWLHVLAGIVWIGLLYYLNFVQVPAMGDAMADKEGPGPAAISKYVAPKALLWFRMSAAVTWILGLVALESGRTLGMSITSAFTLQAPATVIGIGVWLGTIMAFNVWFIIWPNQKKVLGLVEATDEVKAKAKRVALLASRTNVVLSIPMLLAMIAQRL